MVSLMYFRIGNRKMAYGENMNAFSYSIKYFAPLKCIKYYQNFRNIQLYLLK